MSPFLLIGLGNPGPSYGANRHNAGFMVIEQVIADYGYSKPVRKFGGAIAEGNIGGIKTFVFCPLGYMNTSGGPASEAARFYKIPPEHIIIVHDELDLPLGKLKVKRGGGNGGHNGLRSIDSHLGTDYTRVRFGIGHPGHKDLVSDYVLSDFRKEEWPAVEQMTTEISRHLPLLLQGDEAGFMNKVALAIKSSENI